MNISRNCTCVSEIMLAANNISHFILKSSSCFHLTPPPPPPQIFEEDMMRSLLQNSLHVFRAISGTSTDLS